MVLQHSIALSFLSFPQYLPTPNFHHISYVTAYNSTMAIAVRLFWPGSTTVSRFPSPCTCYSDKRCFSNCPNCSGGGTSEVGDQKSTHPPCSCQNAIEFHNRKAVVVRKLRLATNSPPQCHDAEIDNVCPLIYPRT